MIKLLRAIGIAFAALVLAGVAAMLIGGPGLLPSVMDRLGLPSGAPAGSGALAGVPIGGPFTLTDAKTGAQVTDATYRGRWMLVYFGYTYCPDVCPTDLQKMVAALAALGAPAQKIAPIFITVDPARDNGVMLARYVALFSPQLIGLTGSQGQIDAAIRAYRVYVEKLAPSTPGGVYLINHSAFMYLMTPDGKLAGLFPPDITVADLTHKLAAAMAAAPAS